MRSSTVNLVDTENITKARQQELAEQQFIEVPAIGDGNCAFNALALGLIDLMRQENFPALNERRQRLFIEAIKQQKGVLDARAAKYNGVRGRAHYPDLADGVQRFINFVEGRLTDYQHGGEFTFEQLQQYIQENSQDRLGIAALHVALAPALRLLGAYMHNRALHHATEEAVMVDASLADFADAERKNALALYQDGMFAGRESILPLAHQFFGIRLNMYDSRSKQAIDAKSDVTFAEIPVAADAPVINVYKLPAHWNYLLPAGQENGLAAEGLLPVHEGAFADEPELYDWVKQAGLSGEEVDIARVEFKAEEGVEPPLPAGKFYEYIQVHKKGDDQLNKFPQNILLANFLTSLKIDPSVFFTKDGREREYSLQALHKNAAYAHLFERVINACLTNAELLAALTNTGNRYIDTYHDADLRSSVFGVALMHAREYLINGKGKDEALKSVFTLRQEHLRLMPVIHLGTMKVEKVSTSAKSVDDDGKDLSLDDSGDDSSLSVLFNGDSDSAKPKSTRSTLGIFPKKKDDGGKGGNKPESKPKPVSTERGKNNLSEVSLKIIRREIGGEWDVPEHKNGDEKITVTHKHTKSEAFDICANKFETDSSQVQTFEAMLRAFKVSNGGRNPVVATSSEDLAKLWKAAFKNVYGKDSKFELSVTVSAAPQVEHERPFRPGGM